MPRTRLAIVLDATPPAPFTGFHNASRPDPLARVAIGGEPATAQLDATVDRLRARDELLLTDEIGHDGNASTFFRTLTIMIVLGIACWIGLGLLLAWLAGRL